MLTNLWKGYDRRRFPRSEASFDVNIMVEVYGFEDEVAPFFASGETTNVSRLGVLARLDAPIHPGSVCKVFFRGTGEQIRPHHVAGRVTRCSEQGDRFDIAVEFDEALLRLDVANNDEAEQRSDDRPEVTTAER